MHFWQLISLKKYQTGGNFFVPTRAYFPWYRKCWEIKAKLAGIMTANNRRGKRDKQTPIRLSNRVARTNNQVRRSRWKSLIICSLSVCPPSAVLLSQSPNHSHSSILFSQSKSKHEQTKWKWKFNPRSLGYVAIEFVFWINFGVT